MSVTEYERNQLFVWFEEHMGSERAATMMNLLPPVGWADVATKRDLDHLEARIASRIGALDTRIDIVAERLDAKVDDVAGRLDAKVDAVAGRLDAKIDAVAEALDAKIDAVAGRLDAKIDAVADQMATKADLHALHSDLQRTLVPWIFASQATVVAAVGVLFAVLR
jgi:phage-related minor tail protein